MSDPGAGRSVTPWRRTIALWAPALVWMAVLFSLSAQSSLPSVADGLSDKVEHAGAYAALGVLLLRAVAGGRWAGVGAGSVALAVALAVLYGLSDELHQRLVPDRHFDLLDLMADLAGSAAGAGAVWAWSIIRRPRAHQ